MARRVTAMALVVLVAGPWGCDGRDGDADADADGDVDADIDGDADADADGDADGDGDMDEAADADGDADLPPMNGWVRSFDGTAGDMAGGVAVGEDLSVVVAGAFGEQIDLDPSAFDDDHTSAGARDVFVVKLDSEGGFLWGRSFGGPGDDRAFDVDVDSAGNVFVTGIFQDTVDFDPGAGTAARPSNGAEDVFVVSLTADGSYRWSGTFGGSATDGCPAAALAPGGELVVTGCYQGTADLDPTDGVDEHTRRTEGFADIFVVKLETDGSYRWGRNLGPVVMVDLDGAVAVADDGDILVGASFSTTSDLDPGPEEVLRDPEGDSDLVLVELDESGQYTRDSVLSGPGGGFLLGIAAAPGGEYVVTGAFSGGIDLDPGDGEASSSADGLYDAFLLRLDGDGDHLWSMAIGGSGPDFGVDVAAAADDVATTGWFAGTVDFDPGAASASRTAGGDVDGFVARYGAGGACSWVGTFGGVVGSNRGEGVAYGSEGSLFVAGSFDTWADVDPGPAVDERPAEGATDVLVMRLLP